MTRKVLFIILYLIHGTSTSLAQVSADFGSGAIRVGESITTCTTLLQGAVRFDSADRKLKLCDANQWKALVSDFCSTSLPADITFTDLTGQSRSTLLTSNIQQVTGLATCTALITVSGAGAPEYRICDDASCTSVSQTWSTPTGSITNNKYVQLRLTSSPHGNHSYTASLDVGLRSERWSVTTTGNCADVTPAIGTFCTDGSIYVGMSPDGGTKMYATPCYHGKTWTGTACTGVATSLSWASAGTVATGVTNVNTGEANTTTLAGLAHVDAPFSAAAFCFQFSAHGQTDWYLPSQNEGLLFQTACGVIPDITCLDGNRSWTSRESSITDGIGYAPSGSGGAGGSKTAQFPIRCVRKD